MDASLTPWIIGFLFAIVLIAGLLAFGFIAQLMKKPEAVAGKKDIYTRIYFLFGVVATLSVVASLAVTGAIEKSLLAQVVVMIVTALGVKKIDDSSSKD